MPSAVSRVGRLPSLFLISLLIGLTAVAAISDDDFKPRMMRLPDPDWKPANGDRAEIAVGGGKITYGATNLLFADDLLNALRAGDGVGLSRMVADGTALVLENRDAVLVLDVTNNRFIAKGATLIEVRMESGKNRGAKVHVARPHLASMVDRLVKPPMSKAQWLAENNRAQILTKLRADRRMALLREKAQPVMSQAKAAEKRGDAKVAASYYASVSGDFQGTPEADDALKKLEAKGESLPTAIKEKLAYPLIAGRWQESPGVIFEVTQNGPAFDAKVFYYHPWALAIRATIKGTIGKDGAIVGELVHTMAPADWKAQRREGKLSPDRKTIAGRASWDGGGQEFTWTRLD